MFDFSNFPSVCRMCFKPAQDCNISTFVRMNNDDKDCLTYEDLLDDLSFVPPVEYASELPVYLCKTCAHLIEEFSNLRQQARHILKFSIALLEIKQKNDSLPLIGLFQSDKSDQLRHLLCRLKVIDNDEFTIEHLLHSIGIECKIETPETKEIVFAAEIYPDIDIKSEISSDEAPEQESCSDEYEEPSTKIKRKDRPRRRKKIIQKGGQESCSEEYEEPSTKIKRKDCPKSRQKIIRKGGQTFKLCPLDGCGEEYPVTNKSAYLQHENKFHRYGCNVCGRLLASRTSVGNHVRLHDGEAARAKCDFCDRTFTTKGGMMVHVREVHNNTGIHFSCQYCERGFMEHKDLLAHINDHRVCKICDETFDDFSGLIRHNRKQHPDTLFLCQHCDFRSLSQPMLDRHKRLKHSESGTKTKLKRHTIFAINSATFHQCPRCNLQFTTEDFLVQHNDQVHNRPQPNKIHPFNVKRRSQEEIQKFPERYKCDDCGKKYRFKNSLWSHRHMEHNTEGNTSMCEVCGQNFKTSRLLKQHVTRMHSTEWPANCSQ